MKTSLAHGALVFALTLAALPRAGSAGVKQVSLAPLFDTHQRFKTKTAVKLRFQAKDTASGAAVPRGDISFFLRHGPKDAPVVLAARVVKPGVFEVPFAPQGPGQYAIVVAVRGTQVGSIAPVRLGVIGVADGLIEVPPSGDAEFQNRAKNGSWRSGR
jgi:hypothetical protein